MKSVIKGVLLGIVLVIAASICGGGYVTSEAPVFISGTIVFFAVTYVFLVSNNIVKLLVCGFVGVGVMFALQIFLLVAESEMFFGNGGWLIAYAGGFWGSMTALAAAIVATVKRGNKEGFLMNDFNKTEKTRLLLCTLITAVGFGYLVMPQYSALGILVFAILELVCIQSFVKDKKRLVLFVPILIMAANSFISANTIWRIPNFLLSIVLTGCIFCDFEFKNDSFGWLTELAKRLVAPFNTFSLPFGWTIEMSNGKAGIVKRVLLALGISVPCAAVLITVLSNADMVFSLRTEQVFEAVFDVISLRSLYIICCSIFAALYLFGIVLHRDAEFKTDSIKKECSGDLIIINILLSVVLVIYTMFAVVQFKYLFATAQLPEGLSYTEYARKGFFELLALTGVNIAGILAVVRCTKSQSGAGAVITKVLCHCLCAATVLLLASSFYRMCLYTNDDGLTRLRLYVLGFLIFEAIGLLATFVYIQKPKFNIVLIYSITALSYYCILNVVPTDSIIAYEQNRRYLFGERNDISYVLSLSADAVPAMEYLVNNTDDENVKNIASGFIKSEGESEIPKRWQRFNISRQRAERIRDKLIKK